MILHGDNEKLERDGGGQRATLDELFRRAGVRDSNAIALIDPPNRESFTDGAPRQLSFAQADRAISALAAKLCRLGLRADTVVAIQLANTVEAVVTLLAVLRAGMIAVPLPVLWRRHELTTALRYIGAKAIVTSSRIGSVAHAEIAMQGAADFFPVRFICAFGNDMPDGVLPLDDVFITDQSAIVPRSPRTGHAADHVAVITMDVTASGLVPVARSHMELLAGGVAGFLETGAVQNAHILSAIPPSSFAGISVTLLPWLIGGGTLSLHHGFDPATFAAQVDGQNGSTIVVPGAAVTPLAAAGHLGTHIKAVVALWRSPEQMASIAPSNIVWRGEATLVDVASFGEIGLLASRRGSNGMPADIPFGLVGAPRTTGAVTVAETGRSKNGTLMLRGPMVPVHAFPPGAEHGPDPHLAADKTGFVDTGFTCRLARAEQTLVVTGPPGGIAAIGGYRFRPREIEALVAEADPTATVVALPGGILAQRLAGSAIDNATVCSQLLESGVNPLIAGAFRPRSRADAA